MTDNPTDATAEAPMLAGTSTTSPKPPVVRPIRRAIPAERPPFRRLNVYAFDPSLSIELENAALNRGTLQVPWEYDPTTGEDTLKPGPVGEYLEVVDADPASNCFYAPVDLNDRYLLAQDGLLPSEGNPQFHQQMVYAVAMTTIQNFEHALGRRALWSPYYLPDAPSGASREEYIPRLRVYPHALREANAYYSPQRKALLFGYFPAPTADVRFHLPGGMVFCCLSHDVVAHETTHALLDGMHRRFIEASNMDVLAFHEAFADVCALFQHFSSPEILRRQIAKTRGDLATENLLGQLAQEFGQATGLHGALRDALGGYNPATGKWERAVPDPQQIHSVTEPHARGSLLVAAIFQAFVSIYRARSADLLRIATGGTGILPRGELHPDLVARLAAEAAKSAQHVLNMCIRALDYCPPVDPTFGDYLRALITADYDLVPDDDLGYRIAVIEAFREYGIYPLDVRSLAVDSLRWQTPLSQDFRPQVLPVLSQIRRLAQRQRYATVRERLYEQQQAACRSLHGALARTSLDMIAEMGLDMTRVGRDGKPVFEVHSARPLRRIGPDGQVLSDAVIEITQRRPAYYDLAVQAKADRDPSATPPPDFWFRGGSTLVLELESGTVRYAVTKSIGSDRRLARERDFRTGQADNSLRAMYYGGLNQETREPFAFLHRMAR
jgi:hypothetical protein